jgi:hypothetical protein
VLLLIVCLVAVLEEMMARAVGASCVLLVYVCVNMISDVLML